MKNTVQESWAQVVDGVAGLHLESFFQLVCAYSQPERRYHNLSHIIHMAEQSVELKCMSTDLHRAIWWHDYFYDSRANDNEERSADELVSSLHGWGVSQAKCDRARTLVMYTKDHEVPGHDEEGKLLIDLDLSILAAREETYNFYAAAIREEYGWVSDEAFRKGRLAFLHSMVGRERIFTSRHFGDRYESLARSNLLKEIERLS